MFDNPQALQQLMIAGGLLDGSMSMGQAGHGLLGIQNAAMRGQQFAQQQKLMDMKMAEYEREQKQRAEREKAFAGLLGTPAQQTPYQMSDAEMFPGEQQIPGLLNENPATGLYKSDPGMAQMMGVLGPEQGSGLMGQMMLQVMKGQDPTSSMQNYQYMTSVLGMPAEQAAERAFGKMTINVGGNPVKPPENFMWSTPENPAASNFEVKPMPGGPADPKQSTSADNMKKYKEGQAKLGQVRQSLTAYRDKLRKYGGEYMPGQDKTDLATSYRDLQLELKELYNLGVLNGPDLMLMEQVLTNPTSLGGSLEQGVYSMFGGDPLGKQLETIFNKLSEAEKRNMELYGPDTSRFSEDVK